MLLPHGNSNPVAHSVHSLQSRFLLPPAAASLADNTRAMASAVLMGTVDFSITILGFRLPQLRLASHKKLYWKHLQPVSLKKWSTLLIITRPYFTHNSETWKPRGSSCNIISSIPKILLRLAYCAMVRPTLSMNLRSAARPFPTPEKGVEPSILRKSVNIMDPNSGSGR